MKIWCNSKSENIHFKYILFRFPNGSSSPVHHQNLLSMKTLDALPRPQKMVRERNLWNSPFTASQNVYNPFYNNFINVTPPLLLLHNFKLNITLYSETHKIMKQEDMI